MRSHHATGRVYRRCGCRDEYKHQLGTHCPLLAADPDHGTWTFAVEIPATEPGGHNHTVRRGGFPTADDARTALHRYLTGRSIGISADPNQTVEDYLAEWLAGKKLRLKPTTWVRYRDYTRNDLIPALGPIRLDDLAYEHLLRFTQTQLTAGRGRQTVWHILATLSSALGDAVRTHRLSTNVARPTAIPRPAPAERVIWTTPKPCVSWTTATRMTRTSPISSSCSSVPDYAGARRSRCTGPTSTSTRTGSTSAGRCPPSTTTSSS